MNFNTKEEIANVIIQLYCLIKNTINIYNNTISSITKEERRGNYYDCIILSNEKYAQQKKLDAIDETIKALSVPLKIKYYKKSNQKYYKFSIIYKEEVLFTCKTNDGSGIWTKTEGTVDIYKKT